MSEGVTGPEPGVSRETRRSFLGRLLGGALLVGTTAILGAIVAYLTPSRSVRAALGPRRVKVGRADDLPPGRGRLTLVDDEPVWVVNLGRGFAALSAVCTHKGCVLRWDDGRRLFQCPCHDGRFDDRGNVVSGLPRHPLARYAVAVVDGDVYVSHGGRRGA
jgi:cytochrome b6-f complex iron-sulfur subunit